MPPREWLQVANSESSAECHTRTDRECAGMAIYRTNTFKRLRDPKAFRLPGDIEIVFASAKQFEDHHNKMGFTSADVLRKEKS